MFPRWLHSIVIVSIAAEFFLVAPRLQADDLLGANQLLQKLKSAAKPAAAPTATGDDAAHLAKDVTLFLDNVGNLAPTDAATQWLALCNRSIHLHENPAQMGMMNGIMSSIFQSLPGPESWPLMQKMIESNTTQPPPDPWQQGLLTLAIHTLNNDEQKQWADIAQLESTASTPSTTTGNQGGEYLPSVLSLGSKLSSVAEHSDDVEKFWNQILDDMEKITSNPGSDVPDESVYELPDLVPRLGEAKAQPIIQRALLLPHMNFSTIDGKETAALARKIALANIDKLPQAPWALTESLDGSDLFEALLKKFGASPANQNGAIYHVLALAIQGKQPDAVKAAESINGANLEDAVNKAAEAGFGMQVYDFLHALLQSHPENDDWTTYVNLAAQTGHAPEALQFVQNSLARTDLNDAVHAKIQAVLYRALLAVDKVDEGIAQLRALIKKAQSAPATVNTTSPDMSYASMGSTIVYRNYSGPGDGPAKIVGWGIQLARIGHLLKRDDLEKEGLAVAKSQPPSPTNPDSLVIPYLMETGRYAEAEKLLIDAIVAEAAKESGNPQDAYQFAGAYSPNQQNLIKLAQVYYATGRWADILTLLEQVPGWGAADLVKIAQEKSYSERYTPPSLGLMAARALWETGRQDAALTVLDYVLQVDAGDDAVYQLLLKIGKGDLVAKLDALYRQDQFQNRPLIWKATLLLQQGKIADAEQACKTAISIDPSDGETGKGNRMRVYSVMADVCDAKKDAKQADFFRNVIKAIRLSEDADDYYDAGLLTRAVTMYAQALDLFSDAYCIQSRIARQLAELGRTEEAAVHYRKAFELMPVSFGRMESHCFGCERAFEGKTAAGIAEQTFTDMLARDPKKPQLYYLLGYLYMEEEHYAKAVTNFQKAAELDPDYINAWKQIVEVGSNYQLSPSLRDEAVFNVIRLDPAGRHINPGTDGVRQLAKLWNVEADSIKAVPPPPTTLFPLIASATQQATRKDQMQKMIPAGVDPALLILLENQASRYSNGPKDASAPRNAVLSNGVITTALQFFR